MRLALANYKSLALALLTLLSLMSMATHAEQKVMLGEHEVHYIVVPTTFLNPAIASQYELPRGKDHALVNVSVLGPDGQPTAATLRGESKNLLGQIQTLEFREVREPPAIYYLALIRHTDEETHRIKLTVELKDGSAKEISLQQKLYWPR